MADVSLIGFGPTYFYGDENGIIDASDIGSNPDSQNGRPGLKFADGSAEVAAVSYSFAMPSQYDGSANIKVKLAGFGDSAPGANNKVDFEVAWEAVTDGDAHDLQGSCDYFAAVQSGVATVDATAGYAWSLTITFTNAQADSVQPGDRCRIVIRRDSDDGTNDTYADSVWLENVEVFYVE